MKLWLSKILLFLAFSIAWGHNLMVHVHQEDGAAHPEHYSCDFHGEEHPMPHLTSLDHTFLSGRPADFPAPPVDYILPALCPIASGYAPMVIELPANYHTAAAPNPGVAIAGRCSRAARLPAKH